MLETSSSLGECITIEVDPNKHMAHPILPNKFRRSFNNLDDKTALKSF